jgi:hypothetical protein
MKGSGKRTESHHMVNYRDGRDRSFVMHPQGPEQVMKEPGEARAEAGRGNEKLTKPVPQAQHRNLGTGICSYVGRRAVLTRLEDG